MKLFLINIFFDFAGLGAWQLAHWVEAKGKAGVVCALLILNIKGNYPYPLPNWARSNRAHACADMWNVL
jgi:hypothetical protein